MFRSAAIAGIRKHYNYVMRFFMYYDSNISKAYFSKFIKRKKLRSSIAFLLVEAIKLKDDSTVKFLNH